MTTTAEKTNNCHPEQSEGTRQGYKKTELGWIPEEWQIIKVKSIVDRIEAGVSVNSEDRVSEGNEWGILKTSCVTLGKFDKSKNKVILEKEKQRAKVNPQKDCIIVSRMNTPELVGANAYVDCTYQNLFLPDRLWQVHINNTLSNSRWLSYITGSKEFRRNLSLEATGTSNSMKNISQENFLGQKIIFAPFPEQDKIAEILTTWDSAIEKTERLIASKTKLKQALMQKLLTGKLRFGEFAVQKANIVKLKDYLKEYSVKNSKNQVQNVLSVTNSRGFINQDEQFERVVASKDLKGYKVVKKGQFAYNPSRINVGSIDLLRRFDEGIVSPIYVIFETVSDKLLDTYLGHYFKTQNFFEQMKGFTQGGVRDSLSFDGLCSMKLFIPSLEEQKKIAAVLNTCDKEIDILKQKLDTLQQQKKGLMQKLLTGQVRVNQTRRRFR